MKVEMTICKATVKLNNITQHDLKKIKKVGEKLLNEPHEVS